MDEKTMIYESLCDIVATLQTLAEQVTELANAIDLDLDEDEAESEVDDGK